jgi:hypothetical protein
MNIKMKINVINENERMTQTQTWIRTWTRTWTRTWIQTWIMEMETDMDTDVELLHFSHFQHVSLVQWTNHLLPATGGNGSGPGGATHTLELGLPVSAVSLQWSPRHDP